jgi:8-oxo-dGTP pyrophosphatase MutT (NUDIX family)
MMRQVATFLQKAPWVAAFAQSIWRIKQPKFSAGVVGVVFDELGRVLLVEHVFHPYAPWGLPGGWVDRAEHPAQTIEREMLEELGMRVQVGPILLAEIDRNHLDMAYLCSAAGSIGKLSSELLDVGWYGSDSMPTLLAFHRRAIYAAHAFQAKLVKPL